MGLSIKTGTPWTHNAGLLPDGMSVLKRVSIFDAQQDTEGRIVGTAVDYDTPTELKPC